MTQRYHIAIKDLPADERPRERLARYGPGMLSTAELLAIILRTGTRQESAIHVAQRLLGDLGTVREIVTAGVDQLSRVRGIGPAKAIEIKAALELGRRLLSLSSDDLPVVRDPADVMRLLGGELSQEVQEHFKVVLLDSKNQVRKVVTATIGTLNASLVHPREVFRQAITSACNSVILAHNHPSGDPTPSREDLAVTKQLSEAGAILGIEVLDHVIVGGGRYLSMKQRGLM